MTVFEFDDYREYLRAYIVRLPKAGRGELTRIAAHLGVNTTLLSQVFSGTREFNAEQTYELSLYLGHTELEADYFSVLTQIERAGSIGFKKHLKIKREQMRTQALQLSKRIPHERSLTDEQRSIFYSSWIYSAVHLFTSTNADGVTLDDVSARFRFHRAKAIEVLQFLTKAKVVLEENGVYKIGVLSTFLNNDSPHLIKHHVNWRMKAAQKSETLADEELMFTGQVSLSREDFHKIRERITEFINEAALVAKESSATDIASLNIDWFWIER